MDRKTEKIRIALVGCGRIAKNHIAAIGKHSKQLEIVDVCDIDATALNSACSQTGQ